MSEERRNEIVGVLTEHATTETFTKPSRRKGITEWGRRCTCGVEMPWASGEREAAHRDHVADALIAHLEESR